MLKKRKQKKKKIVFISNSCWYLYNFRKKLIKDVIKENYEVLIIAPNDIYKKKLESFGFKVYPWSLNRSSLNPILELFSKKIIQI